MISAVFKYLFEHIPTLAAFLLTIVAVIFGCYKIFKFYFTRFKKLEHDCGKISGLESAANIHSATSTRIEHSLDEKLLPRIDGVISSINGLLIYLSSKDKNFKSDIYVVRSPVQLSNIGIDILEKSNGKKFVDDAKEDLIKQMEGQSFKSALDVQNYARIILFNNINTDNFTLIKNYIFNNPLYVIREDEKLEINLNIMVDIIAIYLRNVYFDKHPELKDVDEPKQDILKS